MLKVLSLGAGVQSTTMALMAAHGEITPMPDCAIFADTQNEPKAVYTHLQWMMTPGVLPFPIHIVTEGNLRKSAIHVRRTLDGERTYTATALPVYSLEGDEVAGIGMRQCTSKFKIEPIHKKVRQLLGKTRITKKDGILVEMWIGISLDEIMRRKPSRKSFIVSRWPLIEKNLTRQGCLDWLKANNYPLPPRSACTFCPYRSDIQWSTLTAEEFADAVQMERELQLAYKTATATRTTPFLHRQRIPLDQVTLDLTPKPEKHYQLDMFNSECEGMCGV